MSTSINKAVREDAYRLLLERRADIYSKVAAFLMDIEGALALEDWERCRYHLQDLRRTLRTSLAFLTDEVYEELEQIENICDISSGSISDRPPEDLAELRDHLQLLHVKLSRSLKMADFQDLEDIVGMDLRLKKKLSKSRENLTEKIKQREIIEQAWALEASARQYLTNNKPRNAIKALTQAIRLDPNRPVFHNDLGYVHGLLSQLEKSVAAYRQAVHLNERFADMRSEEWTTSYFNLGIALRKIAIQGHQNQHDEKALAYAREAIDAFQNYLEVTPTGSKVSVTRNMIVQLSEVIDLLEERLSPPRESDVA